MQQKEEMFRKELTNESCQSDRSFTEDQDSFSQQLHELCELWEARAQEWAREEGEPEEMLRLYTGKHHNFRNVDKASQVWK